MQRFEVEYFEKEDGTYPAEEFILSQDVKMRAKLFRLLELLEEKGNTLREPYSKSLDDGIFEIRAKQGSNITRVLYFFLHRQQNYPDKRFYKEKSKNSSVRN